MLELYGAEPGKTSFANNCLLARRLVESGVRFVQLFDWGWDHHGSSDREDSLRSARARLGDRPADAALITRSEAARPAGSRRWWSGAANSGAHRCRRIAAAARTVTSAATIIPTASPCGWPAAV